MGVKSAGARGPWAQARQPVPGGGKCRILYPSWQTEPALGRAAPQTCTASCSPPQTLLPTGLHPKVKFSGAGLTHSEHEL